MHGDLLARLRTFFSDNSTKQRTVFGRALGWTAKMPGIPLDLRYLDEITRGDRQFLAELVGDFVDLAQELLLRLEVACDANDCDEVRIAAHALRGSSLSVGAMRLSYVACQLQTACENHDVVEVPALIQEAKAEFLQIAEWWERGTHDYAA